MSGTEVVVNRDLLELPGTYGKPVFIFTEAIDTFFASPTNRDATTIWLRSGRVLDVQVAYTEVLASLTQRPDAE